MEKLPTAEEFTRITPILHDMWDDSRGRGTWNQKEINAILIEFAKLHIKAALKAAEETIKQSGYNDDFMSGRSIQLMRKVHHCYPLTNIR